MFILYLSLHSFNIYYAINILYLYFYAKFQINIVPFKKSKQFLRIDIEFQLVSSFKFCL